MHRQTIAESSVRFVIAKYVLYLSDSVKAVCGHWLSTFRFECIIVIAHSNDKKKCLEINPYSWYIFTRLLVTSLNCRYGKYSVITHICQSGPRTYKLWPKSIEAIVLLVKCLLRKYPSKQKCYGQMFMSKIYTWANVFLYKSIMYCEQVYYGKMSFWGNVSEEISLYKCIWANVLSPWSNDFFEPIHALMNMQIFVL